MSAALPDPKTIKRMEHMEHSSIKSLQKATQGHNRAVTNLHIAQTDLQMQRQQAERFKCNAGSLKIQADQLFKAKHAREDERSRKLADLHAPRSLPSDAPTA